MCCQSWWGSANSKTPEEVHRGSLIQENCIFFGKWVEIGVPKVNVEACLPKEPAASVCQNLIFNSQIPENTPKKLQGSKITKFLSPQYSLVISSNASRDCQVPCILHMIEWENLLFTSTPESSSEKWIEIEGESEKPIHGSKGVSELCHDPAFSSP